MRKTEELAKKFQGGLIVSCQVQPDDPCYSIDFVVKMAKSAAWGGAVGLRANSPDQIAAIKKEVDLPLIGLYKIWHDDTDVFITPTLEAAKQVWVLSSFQFHMFSVAIFIRSLLSLIHLLFRSM